MSVESPHRYLLDLLAWEGPLSGRELNQRIGPMGPELKERMEYALRQLVREGDILNGEGSTTFYVAPARLIPAMMDQKTVYRLIGHPAAEAMLADMGKVEGPDNRGRRFFHTSLTMAELRPRLRRCAIALEVTGL